MNLQIKKIITSLMNLIFLVGIIFAGNSNVLCIGNDGNIKVETICLPCCGETEICKFDVTEDIHDEHSDCNDCYDLELTGSQWLKRNRTTDYSYVVKSSSIPVIESIISTSSTVSVDLNILKYHSIFGQSPPSLSLATVIIRC